MVESQGSSVTALDFYHGHCGYCGNEETSRQYSLRALSLNCQDYQKLMDRGWRRCGTSLYKPDLQNSCCPLYTIRLDTEKYRFSKSNKKVMKRLGKVLKENQMEISEHKKSDPMNSDFDLAMEMFLKEFSDVFRVELEKAKCDDEKFQIFHKYQTKIHKEEPYSVTLHGFKYFLVETCLNCEEIENAFFTGFGTFHQKYYFKDQLVAVGVLDILPESVSSVYLMYDPEFQNLNLGKFSALYEIYFTRKLSTTLPLLKYYYMGYYLHSCPKMRYKADYHPSYLLDPLSYQWFFFEECLPLLQERNLAVFSDQSKVVDSLDEENPIGFIPKSQIELEDIAKVKVDIYGTKVTADKLWDRSEVFNRLVLNFISAIGFDLIEKIELSFL